MTTLYLVSTLVTLCSQPRVVFTLFKPVHTTNTQLLAVVSAVREKFSQTSMSQMLILHCHSPCLSPLPLSHLPLRTLPLRQMGILG